MSRIYLSILSALGLCLLSQVSSFVPAVFNRYASISSESHCSSSSTSSCQSSLRASSSTGSGLAIVEEEVEDKDALVLDKILLSGFVSKEAGFHESDIFQKVFQGGSVPNQGTGSGKMFIPGELSTRTLTVCTDDIPFARKRLVSPKSVYSGLVDALEYAESLDDSLKGQDAWIAYNLKSSEIRSSADLAVKCGVKRVVFAVQLNESEKRSKDLVFKDACEKMRSAGVEYTILKYGDVARNVEEAKFPYRVVRGALELPNPEAAVAPMISSGDFCRIISEVLDIPKTFGETYGVGPGSKVDSEILVYMKSQGWPERVQVGLLVGDMMEKIEKMYEEEAERRIGEYSEVKTTKKREESFDEPNYLLNM